MTNYQRGYEAGREAERQAVVSFIAEATDVVGTVGGGLTDEEEEFFADAVFSILAALAARINDGDHRRGA